MNSLEEKTKVTSVEPPPKPDGPPGDDCLVVIYSKDPALLGKRFLLEASPTRIGRGPDNEIVFDGDSISRRHASWERRGSRWWVVDEHSTNGTYVNDELIDQEHPLSNGDRVKVGGLIIKFLSGDDVESQYHEEIYRMTIFDGLMQVYNRRYLYEALEREIIRARRHGRDLSIVMFDIDHFKQVNDRFGHLAGDFVLKELARVVQAGIRRDEVFARYGGEEFSLVLPETNLDGAAAVAETLRHKISKHPFTFQNETIPVTVSAGVAALSSVVPGSFELIQQADEMLYIAKRQGRDRVVSALQTSEVESLGGMTHAGYRRVIDGKALVGKVLAQASRPLLLAFELGDEIAIRERLGSKTYEEWFRQLVRTVELALGPDDELATWLDRYVLATLRAGEGELAEELTAKLKATWAARPAESDNETVSRRLRCAWLSPEELGTHHERSLDVLVARLLERPTAEPTPEDELPFPLAALRAMVAGRRTPLGRVKSLLDGVETTLRFLVGIELGVMQGLAGPIVDEKIASAITNRGGLNGAWEYIALDLANLLRAATPFDPQSAVSQALRELSRAKVGQVSLAERLRWAAGVRRAVQQKPGLSEDARGSDEKPLEELLGSLLAALAPLWKLHLVSVAQIEAARDGGRLQYGLYLHRGPGEYFPIIQRELAAPLEQGWCYLLSDDPERAPICLAPVVASRPCDTCGRIEVAIAERLVLGPEGAAIPLRGVTTNHEVTLEVPRGPRLPSLHQAVLTRARLEVTSAGLDPMALPPRRLTSLRTLRFLHLTDWHVGMVEQGWLWPNVREAFFEDVTRLYNRLGGFDAVFFTGDMTQRGSATEFAKLDEWLTAIWKHLSSLGADPVLIAVPGNHDLTRPSPKSAVVKALGAWHADPEIRDTFWVDPDSDYRQCVRAAFSPYAAWAERQPTMKRANPRWGALPGDLAATLDRDGLRVGVVGLNTAFLQLTGADYEKKLDLDVRQLHAVCGGDAPAWLIQNDLNLLLTHHPPVWLEPKRLKGHFETEVAPPGRFALHLHGHLHEPNSHSEAVGGSQLRHRLAGPSLFGLEHFEGPGGVEHQRIHGYMAGRIELAVPEEGSPKSKANARVQLWPRRLITKASGARRMERDNTLELEDDDSFVFDAPCNERVIRTTGHAGHIEADSMAALQPPKRTSKA